MRRLRGKIYVFDYFLHYILTQDMFVSCNKDLLFTDVMN